MKYLGFVAELVQHCASHDKWMNGKALDEVDQFKYLRSTQTKDGISIKEVKIRLVQAHSATTRLVVQRKIQIVCQCQYCSIDV